MDFHKHLKIQISLNQASKFSNHSCTLSVTPSYVGDLQIDVEVKKYFCKAGVKGMQVGLTSGPFYGVFALSVSGSGEGGGARNS